VKPWQIVVALIVPGGLIALAVLAFLRGARERPVSAEWMREQSYDKSGY